MEGIKALGYLALFQVTRCKSGTYISHHQRKGYVHRHNLQRLNHSHRWQAKLPQVSWVFNISTFTPDHCGSLACQRWRPVSQH